MAGNQSDLPPDGGGKDRNGLSSASEEELASRLDRLSSTLDDRRKVEQAARRKASGDNSGYARAVKIGSEFIAGILVGVGIGWLIDQGLGTRPWGMIVFLMIGFAAGILNVLRSEGMVAEPGARLKGDAEGQDGNRRNGDDPRS